MTRLTGRLLICGAVLVLTAWAGISLGHYTLAGMDRLTAPDEAMVQDSLDPVTDADAATPGSAAGASAAPQPAGTPENYVCNGCDAHPPDVVALDDGFMPFDTAPLPLGPSTPLMPHPMPPLSAPPPRAAPTHAPPEGASAALGRMSRELRADRLARSIYDDVRGHGDAAPNGHGPARLSSGSAPPPR